MTTPTPMFEGTLRERFGGVLRGLAQKLALGLFGLLVVVVVMLLNLRGDVHRVLAPLGPQLSSSGMLRALLDRDEPTSGDDRVLVINGQRLHIAIETVEAPVAEALAAALDDCPTRDELGAPVSGGGTGYGLCMHPRPDDAVSGTSLSDRVGAFGDSHDIADLGRLEYIYAETLDGGGTALLRLTSGDSLDLDRLLPTEGDVTGTDPEGIPRPPDGRRALHSYEEGLPYSVTVYGRSERTVAQLQGWYRRHVDSDLWLEVDTAAEAERQGVDISGVNSLIFVGRDDPLDFVLVSFTARPRSEQQDAGTMVTISQAR